MVEPDVQSIDSIFDFLYVDHTRIGILFSQLPDETRGHLKEVLAEDQFTGQTSSSVGYSAGATGNWANSRGSIQKQTLRYDPIWFHAASFLNVFDANGLLTRGDHDPVMSELRLFRGRLSVCDMRLMKPVWAALIESLASSHLTGQMNAQQAKQFGPAMKAALKGFLDGLPQTITGTHQTQVGRLWFTLRQEHLIAPIEEFLLKWGVTFPGEWHVVAIVDGKDREAADYDASGEGLEAISANVFTEVGTMFGRPAGTIAVTPILIFREVTSTRPIGVPKPA